MPLFWYIIEKIPTDVECLRLKYIYENNNKYTIEYAPLYASNTSITI